MNDRPRAPIPFLEEDEVLDVAVFFEALTTEVRKAVCRRFPGISEQEAVERVHEDLRMIARGISGKHGYY